MANENQQNDVAQPDVSPLPMALVDVAALGAKGASRRRFSRAGAGATGVLLTLVSQPGMACSVCRAPSGYQSVALAVKNKITLSHTPANSPVCAGRSPTLWYKNLGSWKTTQFKSAFTCTDTEIGNATAEMLLSLCTSPPYGKKPAVTVSQSSTLAMWLVAAYLNVQYGYSPFLKIETLQGIWREFQLHKTYTPTAGVTPWNYADIIVYLSGTMD